MSPEIENQALTKLCIYCHSQFSAGVTVCPDDGTTLTELKTDNLVGTTFDNKYEILEVVGGGGMGTVYRARHRFMKRIVAIKVLHNTELTSADAIKRFQIEAQAASALKMPNITTIFDFGSSPNGQPYMVMDYLDGRSLKEMIDCEGKLPIGRAVHIIIQMSRALAHAHAKGIIHRDIKPSNIVLINFEGDADFVQLVDFGIAKLVNPTDTESGNLTRTGEIFGTALYMSPEQCRGQKLDARTDMYSLGAVMYFALAGRPIFEDHDPLRIVYKHVTEMPASFKSVGEDVSPELEEIVFRALAKDPDARYQSMQDLTAALEQFRASISPEAVSGKQTEAKHVLPITPTQDLAKGEPHPIEAAPDTVPNTADNTLTLNSALPPGQLQAPPRAQPQEQPQAQPQTLAQEQPQAPAQAPPTAITQEPPPVPAQIDQSASLHQTKEVPDPERTVKAGIPKRVIASVAIFLVLLIAAAAIALYARLQQNLELPAAVKVAPSNPYQEPLPTSQPTAQPTAETKSAAEPKTAALDDPSKKASKHGQRLTHRHVQYATPNSAPGQSANSGSNGTTSGHGFGKIKNALKRFWQKIE